MEKSIALAIYCAIVWVGQLSVFSQEELGVERIDVLIGQLRHPNLDERKAALKALEARAAEAKDAIPALRNALKDEIIYHEVTRVLGKIGRHHIPFLIRNLKDNDNNVRGTAAFTLRLSEDQSEVVIQALCDALCDDDGFVIDHTQEALAKIGAKAIPYLIRVIQHEKNPNAKMWASDILAKMGETAEPAMPALIELMKDILAGGLAPRALSAIGKNAIPPLIEHLRDNNWLVKQRTLDAFLLMGPKAEEAVPALVETFKDSDKRIQWDTLNVLGFIGTKAGKAVPALIDFLKDTENKWRLELEEKTPVPVSGVTNRWLLMTTIDTLEKIGPPAEAAIPILIDLLNHRDARVILNAADALESIGAKTEKVVPALVDLLQNPEKSVKDWAIHALAKIGKEDPKVITALIQVLHDKSKPNEMRASGVEILGELGTRATPAIQILGDILDKEADARMRCYAASAIWEIGKKAEKAVPVLIDLLGDTDERLRQHAKNRLMLILKSETGGKAVPLLIEVLRDKSKPNKIRFTSAEILSELGTRATPAAIPVLTDILDKETDNQMRYYAASAIWEIGKNVEKAIPVLIDLLKDSNKDIKKHTVELLGKIGKTEAKAIPPLINALNDPEHNLLDTHDPDRNSIAYIAHESLCDIHDNAVPLLIQAVQDKSKSNKIRTASAVILGRMSYQAEAVIPILCDIFDKETNSEIKFYVAYAITLKRFRVKNTIPVFLVALKNDNYGVRRKAVTCLKLIGPDAKEAIPALREILRNQSEDIRIKHAVEEAITEIQTQ